MGAQWSKDFSKFSQNVQYYGHIIDQRMKRDLITASTHPSFSTPLNLFERLGDKTRDNPKAAIFFLAFLCLSICTVSILVGSDVPCPGRWAEENERQRLINAQYADREKHAGEEELPNTEEV